MSKPSRQTRKAGGRAGAAAIFKAHLLIRNVSFRLGRNASVAWKQLRSGPARRIRKHLGRQTDRQPSRGNPRLANAFLSEDSLCLIFVTS